MRNSNTMAIAPTATISNIVGVSQSIEPSYSQLYVKANMSGDFTVVNAGLVHDLKVRGLWDEVMVSDLKYYDGKVSQIDRVPSDLKALYATSFEISTEWLIRAAARRQKWIDQGQSLNLYIAQPASRKLDEAYRLAWRLATANAPASFMSVSRSSSMMNCGALVQPFGRWLSRSASG